MDKVIWIKSVLDLMMEDTAISSQQKVCHRRIHF